MKDLARSLAVGCIFIGTMKMYGTYKYCCGINDAQKVNRIVKSSVNNFAEELKEVLIKEGR